MGKKNSVVQIPDFVKEKGESAQKSYIQWVKITDEIHNHPKRYMRVPSKEDPEEFIEVDCIQAINHVRKKVIHCTKDIRDLVEINWKEIQKLKIKKGQIRREWDNIVYSKPDEGGIFDVKRTDIIELFGQYKTVNEVKKIITEEWGYQISTHKVKSFYLANKERVTELRKEWADDYTDFDVAHKRGRLEKLAYLATTQMDKYREKHSIPHSREVRAILEQIRHEIEGEEIRVNIKGEIDIQQTILVNQSINQVTRKVNLNSFIVGLVAAQRGLDVGKFMNILQNSYYAKYTGFGSKKAVKGEEINYPSKIIYNWNEIDDINSEGVEDISHTEEVTFEPENDLRAKLINRVKEKSKNVKT
jgi:hypothetical protein